MNTINNFSGPYRFLSNFFIEPDASCVEVEYQVEKCVRQSDRKMFFGLTPGKAKHLGRTIKLRADWEDIKLGVMHELVLAKFTDHPALRAQLLATGSAELIEGNHWHDEVWGVCSCPLHGQGKNYLGQILMDIRAILKGE